MTEAEIGDRIFEQLLTGKKQKFGPLALIVLEALISGVVSWLVQRCLDKVVAGDVRGPSWLQRQQLRFAILSCSRAAASTDAVKSKVGMGGLAIYREYGGDVYDAILNAGRLAPDHEITTLLQSTQGAKS